MGTPYYFIKFGEDNYGQVEIEMTTTIGDVCDKIYKKEHIFFENHRLSPLRCVHLINPPKLEAGGEDILPECVQITNEPRLTLRQTVKQVFNNGLGPSLVHIVIVPRPTATSSVIPAKRSHPSDDKDICEFVSKAKLANKSPSRMTLSDYRAIQTDPQQRILDGRPKRDGVHQSHYYVPGLDQVNQAATRATVDVFAEAMNKTYDTESERSTAVLEGLNNIFYYRSGVQIPTFIAASTGSVASIGHIIGDHGGLVGVVNVKNEEALFHAIPAAQAKTWEITKMCFEAGGYLVLGGNKITFYAIILLDQYRIVELAAASCNLDAKDGGDRETLKTAFVAASVLVARILEDATKHVNGRPSEIPKVYRRMPAITTLPVFGAEGLDPVEFQIQYYHYDKQSYRHVFIALEKKENKKVIVKFTRQYSIDLHAFCMRLGHAPRIPGYTPKTLPGGWYAIAMEYVEKVQPLAKAERLAENIDRWENELDALVKSYHAEGFVHWDLRDSNIVCDGDKMMLIDFDWGGQADQVSYPIRSDELNKDLLEGRTNSDPKITRDDDIRVLRLTVQKARDKLKKSQQ